MYTTPEVFRGEKHTLKNSYRKVFTNQLSKSRAFPSNMVKVDGSQLQHKVIIMNSVVYRQTKPIMSIINLADQIQYKIQPKVYI